MSHDLEFVIRMVAEKKWNPRTKQVLEPVMRSSADPLIEKMTRWAAEWTKHGEPVKVVVELREVQR